MAKHQDSAHTARPRTVSSPIPYASPNTSRPLSPGESSALSTANRSSVNELTSWAAENFSDKQPEPMGL